MKLSFVIPAYNEEDYIGDCLRSILEESSGKDYGIEIIVINNASFDKTKEVACSFEDVRVVDEARKGLTRARQRGLEEARGEFLAYLDADTRITSGWFDIIEQKLFNNNDIVCYSGPYRYYDGSKYQKTILEFLWNISAPIAYMIVGFMVLGGNFVARKEALKKMGGFDTDIEFYGEDTDVARRISKFGKSVFDMDFFVYSSSRRFSEQGMVRISWKYAANFIWQVLFHKPYTNE
ncbi:MAG: glycosyltransferase [Candidatus Moranbacteria bacterium]|nr:glycosyltransferase [Candidatus Moranbacteria bacterium]